MSYFIVAYNNSYHKIIESETRTSDKELVPLIVANLEGRGFYVTVREEG